VLHHCAEVFAIQGKQKGITIDVKCAPGLIVAGDADRLEQVFNNLIDNAVKNSASEGTIIITGHAEGNQVRAVVTDDGPGIAPDQLPYVFERFYQVTGARTGVGLGLAITKEIVTAHGGTIQASSEPGHGARFTVSLPKSGPEYRPSSPETPGVRTK
jgi:signal transduction histidine kinase